MRTKSRPTVEKAPANFEEVRRRFIRQNRDLAKNNSAQSLRIRSLELEVSRLLADNLELRNQALSLQNEVYTMQRKAGASVKGDLRNRLEALIGVVDAMEDGHEDAILPPVEKKPFVGNWRERQPLSELMRDSQMPTITEDKQYPRRTLGANELQAIRLSDHSSNESPDLGPPPIARFEYEATGDPAKNASPLGSKASSLPATNEEDEELPATISVNLETRRKRKDDQPRVEIRRRSLMPPQSPEKEAEQPSAILRTGAKRKLADRETGRPIKPPSKGDFTFSRKVSGEEVKVASSDQDKPARGEEQPIFQGDQARKVLGDKSVNMSPRKPTAPLLDEKPDMEKSGMPNKPAASRFQPSGKDKNNLVSRRRRTSSIPLPLPQDDVADPETVEISPLAEQILSTVEVQPKTPAMDLFSPTPSEPSARPEGRGDTPPPGDLSTMSIATDGGSRPSRRARAAVNYAEPSLNAKMRRPDKKMVDAISGLQHYSRAMSSTGARESESRSVIKAEPTENEDHEQSWKDLPPAHLSPLGQKGAGFLPISVADPAETATVSTFPAPAPAPSVLADSRRRRASTQRQHVPRDLETAMRKMEEMDIYDFTESSSPLTDSSVASTGGNAVRVNKAAGGDTGRSHRRHSSVPKALDGVASEPVASGAAGEERSTMMKGSQKAASRRRSMML